MKKLYFIILMLIALSTQAQFTKLHDFVTENNLQTPYDDLITDGTWLYGMTTNGGANGYGNVFKIKSDGTLLTNLHDFNDTDGRAPLGGLTLSGSVLYGMTTFGGANDKGVVFKVNTDGTGYAKLLDFDGANNGSKPYGSLIISGSVLYGMTTFGGTNDKGVIFKISTTGSYTKLYDFNYGANPYGSLVLSGSTLYGVTRNGNTIDLGTLFKINIDGTGFYSIKEFTGDNGANPLGSLIISNSVLYGTTYYGGTWHGSADGYGVIFSIKTDGSGFTILRKFLGEDGANPYTALTLSGTTLYGTTRFGTASDKGAIFRISTTGTNFTRIHDFDGINGGNPVSTLILSDSKLLGMTNTGGQSNYGVIFKVNTTKLSTDSSGYTKLLDFKKSTTGISPGFGAYVSDGTWLYGETDRGGIGYGTVFKIKPDGTSYTKLFDCDGVNKGSNPTGFVLSGSTLYGTTNGGGEFNMGIIFKINTDGTGYTKLLDFGYYDSGANPCKLTLSGSVLYGCTTNGGNYSNGVIFKVNTDGTAFTKLFEFGGNNNGDKPNSYLILAGSTLYGTTINGGVNNLGVVFKINTDGTGFTKLLDFDGTKGANPYSSLTISGTTLFGMTNIGGTNNKGVIFKISTTGTGFTKLLDFDGTNNGANPYGSLIFSGTSLAGITNQGGVNDKGVLFKINTDGTGYTKLMDFDGATTGGNTIGSLYETNCILYGAMSSGGSYSGGTIFKYDLKPASAGTITGTHIVKPAQTGVVYSVPAITNATSYTWSYSGLSASINGTGNSVTINFGSTATSGNLTVKGTNTCGDGLSSTFPVTVASPHYVNATTGSNTTGDGSLGKPWKTITYALQQMSGTGQHSIYVAAGTYNTTLGETFPLNMVNGVSLVGAGNDVTVIYGESNQSVIKCVGITDAYTRIEGFTIKKGGGTKTGSYFYGGGLHISAGSVLKVANNKITENNLNYSWGKGGGVYISQSSPHILGNTISSNYSNSFGDGAAIYVDSGTPLIQGNIIDNNSDGYDDESGAVYLNGAAQLVNNIISNNSSSGVYCNAKARLINNTISDNRQNGIYLGTIAPDSIMNNIITYNTLYGIYESSESGDPVKVWYNVFYANNSGLYFNENSTDIYKVDDLNSVVTECKNNLSGSPWFVSKAIGDYHLSRRSIAIDGGDPTFSYGNEPEPNGSRIDVGAYGNTTDATTSGGFVPQYFDCYVNAITGNNTTGDGTINNPWKTITYALSKIANSGVTIHVAAGTYNKALGEEFPIVMIDGISLVGAGMDASIIDGGTNTSVIKCIGIFDASTRIEGFTITNGGGTKLGSNFFGGGIFITAGSLLTISGNKITENRLVYSWGSGGGIYISESSPKILNNTISSNSSNSFGSGSGIFVASGVPLIEGNIIANNTDGADDQYAAIHLNAPVRLVNNLIANNSGSGIYCNAKAKIINNTISDNHQSGIYIASIAPDSIINNIISYNTLYGIFESSESGDPGIVWYNLFYINNSGLYRNENTTDFYNIDYLNADIAECQNNISVQPLFVNATTGDYHLQAGSKAIDAGDPTFLYSNEPVPNGYRINIGHHGNTSEATTSDGRTIFDYLDYYVNATTGSNSTGEGTASKPWKTITHALEQMSGTGQHTIHVQAGTYSTALGEVFPIRLVNGVSLSGAGIDISIISGENNKSVILGVGIFDSDTKIEGFTITDGGGTKVASYYYGGGLYISAGSALTVTGNKIAENYLNYAWGSGGGIYISESSPSIMNNTISSNYSNSFGNGGGIFVASGSPLIEGNIIDSNIDGSGNQYSAVYLNGPARVIRNVISNNTASGIYCNANAQLINNTISDNKQNGIFLASYAPDSILNNIISYNKLYGVYESSITGDPGKGKYNLFYQNTSGMYYDENVSVYSDVNTLNSSVSECKSNISGDPLFVDKANKDYSLQQGSPARNAGDPNSKDTDCTVADIGALPYSNTVASVSINVPNTTVCEAANITFTATPTNGGTSPIYQWKHNGSNVGTNSAQYTTSSLATNDVIYCVMTSNQACTGGSPATSNKLTMTVNPLPLTAGTITGTASVCQGASNVSYTVPVITNATTYKWYYNGGGATINGTNRAVSVNFLALATSGILTVKGSNSCGDGVESNYSVTLNSLPTAFTLSSTKSTYCKGTSGTSLTLSDSQAGVNYQLKKDNVNFGSVVAGTSAQLTWTNITAGVYTVAATNASANCTSTMTGTVTISESALLTVYTLTATKSGYCAGANDGALSLSSSQTGINYQLLKDGANEGTAVAGTGSALAWTGKTKGNYTVIATNATSGCTSNMN